MMELELELELGMCYLFYLVNRYNNERKIRWEKSMSKTTIFFPVGCLRSATADKPWYSCMFLDQKNGILDLTDSIRTLLTLESPEFSVVNKVNGNLI